MQTMENMQLLELMFKACGVMFQIGLWGIFIYFIFISSFAWVRRKEESADKFPPKMKFAVLIAAHNEEKVIASIIKSLQLTRYPNHLRHIYVIADNCTDNTAKVARECGAKVFERFDNVKKGKGFALEWMFENIFNMDEEYDAVCVLDADNLVSANFFMEMNKHLCMGHEVIQGYLDSKNPTDTWISGNNSIAFWVSNRLIQLPRYYLGLSCYIGGTGFVVSTNVLKEIGWGATCLAEDLEFSIKLILKGKKVYWSHEAVIYDEKPLGIMQSLKQRKRWMQGHFDCMSRFFKSLLIRAIKERDIVALDAALYLTQPVILLVNSLMMLYGFFFMAVNSCLNISRQDNMTFLYIIFMLVFMYISIVFVLMEGKYSSDITKYLMLIPIYNLTWVPVIVQGFKDRNKKEWCHTVHTRVVDITEIESVG